MQTDWSEQTSSLAPLSEKLVLKYQTILKHSLISMQGNMVSCSFPSKYIFPLPPTASFSSGNLLAEKKIKADNMETRADFTGKVWRGNILY